MLCSCASKKIEGSDVKGYIDCINKLLNNSDFHSELYIFPNSSDLSNATINEYKYAQRDDLFTGSYYLYCECTYLSKEAFDNEITRLSNVCCTYSYNKQTKRIISYSNGVFLTICKDNRYEYAIAYEESNSIGYVSNQLYEFSELDIDSKYKKDNFVIPDKLIDGDAGYNMYYYYDYDSSLGYVGTYITD